MPITYLFLPENYEHIDGTPGAWAGYPGAKARFVQLFKPWEPYTYYRGEPVHEIGHAMGLRHPFDAHGQGRTSWEARPELRSDFGTIMSYASKTRWVGLTIADIEVLQFLYGAPQAGQAGTQRPAIEAFLGGRANDRRPPAEQLFPQDETLPAPPIFRDGAQVMTAPGQQYLFTAASADLEVHYFIVRTVNTRKTFKFYGFDDEQIMQELFRIGVDFGGNSIGPDQVVFHQAFLLADRLLHKQQLVAVVLDPDKTALWSESFKWLFAYWPSIDAMSDALSDPSRATPLMNDLVRGLDKGNAKARGIIKKLLKQEDIKDDAPVSEKIADLSAYPNAKLIWKGTGSQFLQNVDPEVDAEIFPILSDAQFFEIRADRGLYVRNASPDYGPLDHDAPRDRNGDNKYDLFIEYGEAGAEKHVAFRITVTDEAFEDAVAMSQMAMSQMVVSMDVM